MNPKSRIPSAPSGRASSALIEGHATPSMPSGSPRTMKEKYATMWRAETESSPAVRMPYSNTAAQLRDQHLHNQQLRNQHLTLKNRGRPVIMMRT